MKYVTRIATFGLPQNPPKDVRPAKRGDGERAILSLERERPRNDGVDDRRRSNRCGKAQHERTWNEREERTTGAKRYSRARGDDEDVRRDAAHLRDARDEDDLRRLREDETARQRNRRAEQAESRNEREAERALYDERRDGDQSRQASVAAQWKHERRERER